MQELKTYSKVNLSQTQTFCLHCSGSPLWSHRVVPLKYVNHDLSFHWGLNGEFCMSTGSSCLNFSCSDPTHKHTLQEKFKQLVSVDMQDRDGTKYLLLVGKYLLPSNKYLPTGAGASTSIWDLRIFIQVLVLVASMHLCTFTSDGTWCA
jgi:hypothetical protein